MKHSLLIVALSLGIAALPSIASASLPERDVNYKIYREYRDVIRRLHEHYDRVRAEADNLPAHKGQRETQYRIREDIRQVSEMVKSGHYYPDLVSERAARLNGELESLSENLLSGAPHTVHRRTHRHPHPSTQ